MKFITLLLIASLLSFSSCATRVVTSAPASKVIVYKNAPSNHKVVYVKGRKYYRWNNTYYRKTRRGYVVTRF